MDSAISSFLSFHLASRTTQGHYSDPKRPPLTGPPGHTYWINTHPGTFFMHPTTSTKPQQQLPPHILYLIKRKRKYHSTINGAVTIELIHIVSGKKFKKHEWCTKQKQYKSTLTYQSQNIENNQEKAVLFRNLLQNTHSCPSYSYS